MATTHLTTTATTHHNGNNPTHLTPQKFESKNPQKNQSKIHKIWITKVNPSLYQNSYQVHKQNQPPTEPTTAGAEASATTIATGPMTVRTHNSKLAQTHQDPPQTQPNKSPQTTEIHPQRPTAATTESSALKPSHRQFDPT